ncbi:serine/threonine-protein kinase [Streptomyces rochei]|uniref:serine/threonine-protein kinase n=1 Tax=Streptomyces rochei TaxID=1928 RepID=UPI003D91767A
MGDQDRLVGQRYRLVERVATGGSGRVWRAVDEAAGREVAVKRPRPPGEPGEDAFRRAAHRLCREARAAAHVDHPAAVRIQDVVVEEAGADDGLPWIVMEWVGGESLREVMGRGPVAAPEAARIGLAVLGALRAAHAVGIVHRGLRSDSVLLGPHGRVVLTGFGTAHVPGSRDARPPRRRAPADGRSPEPGAEPLPGPGPAADLWSLGVLLDAAVVDRSAAGPLGPLIERLLDQDPARRPGPGRRPDADEIAEEVARGLAAVAGDLGTAPPRKGVIR